MKYMTKNISDIAAAHMVKHTFHSMVKRIALICMIALMAAALQIPVVIKAEDNAEVQKQRLVDEADLLTDDEEQTLESKLDEISERQECDVVVVTVNSLDGKTAEAYADDFYDNSGYGYGTDYSGILLLVSMEDRDWHISTLGFGNTAVTDAGRDYMAEQFTPALSDGKYAEAFTTYAGLCDDYLTQAKDGEAYDTGNMPGKALSLWWISGDLLIGGVVALMIALYKKSKLKSVKLKATAGDYTSKDKMNLTVKNDRFMNRVVTRRKIEREEKGGTTTHTSSSGREHGGGGGKF